MQKILDHLIETKKCSSNGQGPNNGAKNRKKAEKQKEIEKENTCHGLGSNTRPSNRQHRLANQKTMRVNH